MPPHAKLRFALAGFQPALVALSFLLLLLPPVPAFCTAGDETRSPAPDSSALTDERLPIQQRARLEESLGVDRWHAAGHRGQGLKIAILDSGFRGYQAHLGKALPAHVSARSFRSDGNLEAKDSQHGILCGEVIHALAPDAELLLANWESDRADQFLEAARWARQQGARIISCSLIMPSWSDAEGGGPVHEGLARILGNGTAAGDVLCFASAGNTAQRHWSGGFHAGEHGFHEWEPGLTDNPLAPWGNEPISVELCSRPEAKYEVAVIDPATAETVGQAVSDHTYGCVVVRFTPRPSHTYAVRVRASQRELAPFHLFALGGGLGYVKAHGSVSFPADGPEVIAVGAVDGKGERQAYSSCGPNSPRTKPDLVAVVPFPSLWRPRPFAGTSAAAPQAAALAALLWSRHPQWTAQQLRQELCAAAQDLGPRGPDPETGYGLIHLPAISSR
jgi:subtilisin family serine protease